MFNKKIQKPQVSLLADSSPYSSDSEQNPTFSKIASKKRQSKIICKGLQYTQNQHHSQSQNQSKLNLPITKDPVGGFHEKEWTRHNNLSKNDKGIDKFMEEKLKEFHDKINKVERKEDEEIVMLTPMIPRESQLKNVAEMDKLIEVYF